MDFAPNGAWPLYAEFTKKFATFDVIARRVLLFEFNVLNYKRVVGEARNPPVYGVARMFASKANVSGTRSTSDDMTSI